MLGAPGCSVGVNPSASDLVGKWRVSGECGVEELELRADGTYTYSVAFALGGRAANSGSWKVLPMTSRLYGAVVVLQDALGCTLETDPVKRVARHDRWLRTLVEWGRTILSFDPDHQGFTRA